MNVFTGRRLRPVSIALSAAAVSTALVISQVTPVSQAAAEPTSPLTQITPDIFVPSPEVNRQVTGGDPIGSAIELPPLPGRPGGVVTRVEGADGVGKPGIGAQEFYQFERRQINDRMELDVNTANGNVMVRYRDMSLSSFGLNFTVSHVYNNISQGQGTFGRGWSMTTGRDVHLAIKGDTVTLHGPTAYEAEFKRNGDSFTAPGGMDAELRKGPNGGYELEFDDSEEVWQFSSGGFLVKQLDRNDNALEFRYNANNTLASVRDASGRVTTMTGYDAGGRLTSFEDPSGAEYGPYRYDAQANLTSFKDRGGQDVKFSYDDAGNLTSITDPKGSKWELTYDDKKRVTSLAEPQGEGKDPALTRWAYGNKQTSVTDANGGRSRFEFDDQGRQTKAWDQLGHERSKSWTSNSSVSSTTNSSGNSVTYQYDANDRLVGTELPTGAKSGIGYTDANKPSRPTSFTDPENRKLSYDYDDNGNVTRVRADGLGKDIFTNEYNKNGTVKLAKDGDNRAYSYEYDQHGQVTKVIPPKPRKESTIEYDSLGRMTKIIDGRGVQLVYGYDAFDRVVEIAEETGGVNRPIQRQAFDANGNRIKSVTDVAQVTYSFEPRNQVSKVETVRGTLSAESVSYTYDAVLNLASLTDAGGTVRYAYDPAFRLTAVTDQNKARTTFGYDDDNNRTVTNYPNRVRVNNTFDESSRVTKMVATLANGRQTVNRNYSWKAGGKDTSLLQSESREGTNWSYQYDGLGRLTQAGPNRYGYDTATNLTSAEGRRMRHNEAGQVTGVDQQSFDYDGAGNLSSGTGYSASYSPTNQLQEQRSGGSGMTTKLTYDTSDQTQRATVATSAFGTTVRQQSLTNSALGVTGVTDGGMRDSYVRDPDGTLLQQNPGGGRGLHAITDFQGSVLRLTDANGGVAASYDYTPYGTTKKSDSKAAERNPFRWQGQFQLDDSQGTYLQGARNMSPLLGRFTQPDFTNQEPNPYALAFGDPISFTDPSGNLSRCDYLMIATVVAVLVLPGVGAAAAGLAAAARGTVMTARALGYQAVGDATKSMIGGSLATSLCLTYDS